MSATLFQDFPFVQNDLTQLDPKTSNQKTRHQFVDPSQKVVLDFVTLPVRFPPAFQRRCQR